MFLPAVLLRCLLAVAAGGLIGAERAHHGRAAGMRTHILVCLGSALTALTGIYVSNDLGMGGDAFRISAQVISGVGFLGAGMILIRRDNTISGLTTAAGVWATATIGIAFGYGFYFGAIAVTALFLAAIVFLARFEKSRKQHQYIYIEVNDMNCLNETIEKIENTFSKDIYYRVRTARSGCANHIGLEIDFRDFADEDIKKRLITFENIVFAVELHE